MTSRKSHVTRRCAMGLLPLLLIGCLFLAVGTTWARYRTQIPGSAIFQAKDAPQVYLWGGVTADGSFSPMPASWTKTGDTATLDFCISNGASVDSFSEAYTVVTVRLVGSLGLGAGENLAVQVTSSVLDAPCMATVAPIEKGSSLYREFGDGWLYRFLDADGNELKWELAGGELSVVDVHLTFTEQADTPIDTSLLQLQVAS